MKLIGHEQAGQEIKEFLSLWDSAICTLDIHEIVKLCSSDVCLFDLSSEMHGLAAYQRLWDRYQQFFIGNLKVFRKDVCIYADEQQAFVYGYSKVDQIDAADHSSMPWCRTTMCLRKHASVWKMYHQHISSSAVLESLFINK
ncbi:YybH family protein [Acinetobacter tianfuensis]|uniref:SnoaL-like domain-containing protein n=1 Tax=Acinetobacter tianfuensis TaxID=2419603 RepID=A0A3A8E5H0_9GAMM|nr:nuclear transport factor 2 family protein [Acinetobacter tianfuensis]RKG29399.1 hypothetical protein D7V32_15230 [Acinetobacter tianfuensis]